MKPTRATLAGLLMAGTISARLTPPQDRPHPPAAAMETYGRYSRQNAIDISTPLLQAMLPHTRDLYVDTRAQNLTRRDGVAHPLWVVECNGTTDAVHVQVMYDAVLGKIEQVSFDCGHVLGGTGAPRLVLPTVIARAQGWMSLIAPTERWRLAGKPTRFGPTWHVALSSSARRATLIINGIDGDLVNANIKGACQPL